MNSVSSANFVLAFGRKEAAGDNPWGRRRHAGMDLPSPPPSHQFEKLPLIK